jgi:hypothetical protein
MRRLCAAVQTDLSRAWEKASLFAAPQLLSGSSSERQLAQRFKPACGAAFSVLNCGLFFSAESWGDRSSTEEGSAGEYSHSEVANQNRGGPELAKRLDELR